MKESKKMKRILKTENPIIAPYSHHAHLLSILPENRQTSEWIYSNYIQLYINKDLDQSAWGDFYFLMPYEAKVMENCPLIETQKMKESFIDDNGIDIIQYLKYLIDNDFFIHMMINYKYISKSRFYEKNDKRHDCMVIGYDEEKQLIYCSDFMFENLSYCTKACTFDEFRNAYYNDFLKNEYSYLDHMIYSYRYIKDKKIAYDPKNILYWISCYMNGIIPEYWKGVHAAEEDELAFGIDFYEVLCEYYQKHLDDTDFWLDNRFICVLRDHKIMMIQRLLFLQKEDEYRTYIEGFQFLLEKLNLLINITLKYRMSHKKSILENIIAKLQEYKQMELDLFLKIIC